MKSKLERAVVLREAGMLYAEIARDLEVSQTTAYRWINPDYNEQSRAAALAWKHRNRDRVRAYGREHRHAPCPICDGEMNRNSEMCASCVTATVDVRRTLAEGMWADGWSLREMAQAFGVTRGYFTVARAQRGWDLPHRYRVKQRVAA